MDDTGEAGDRLSAQEAANILRVSRSTLAKLLEDGVIQPDANGRVPRRGVQAFLDGRADRRAQALDAMAETESPSDTDSFVETR